MRDKLEQIILLDLGYSVNHNVDQLLWKSVYHQMIENLRRELQEAEDDSQRVRDDINQLLDEVSTQAPARISANLKSLLLAYKLNFQSDYRL